jgi:phage tail-like protein
MFGKGTFQDSDWPLPSFHFSVKIGTETWRFQEVGNLSSSTEILTYRHGKSGQSGVFKIPGYQKVEDVVLKRGMFTGNTTIYEWFQSNHTPTFVRKDVVISLLDEYGLVEMIWTLSKAFPSKIEGGNFNAKATGDSASTVESITLTFEELVLESYLS